MRKLISDRKGSGLKPIAGSDSRISVPTQSYFNLSPAQAFTIMAIVRPHSINRRNNIISKRSLGSTSGFFGGFLLCIDSTSNIMFVFDENSGSTSATGGRRDLVVSANNLFQVGGEYVIFLSKSTSSGSATPYTLTINNSDYPLTYVAGGAGPLLSSTVTSNTHDLNLLWEDQLSQGTDRTADMTGYDIKIFNKVLSVAEKEQQTKVSGGNIPAALAASLVESWSFEEKEGTTLKGKKGNDGMLVGYTNTAKGALNQHVDELGNSIAA
jgi:hypothetical protein